jgi:hypothetical protein
MHLFLENVPISSAVTPATAIDRWTRAARPSSDENQASATRRWLSDIDHGDQRSVPTKLAPCASAGIGAIRSEQPRLRHQGAPRDAQFSGNAVTKQRFGPAAWLYYA